MLCLKTYKEYRSTANTSWQHNRPVPPANPSNRQRNTNGYGYHDNRPNRNGEMDHLLRRLIELTN